MDKAPNIVSQVLVQEEDETALRALKEFFQSHGMIGLKVEPHNIVDVLRSNIHLGAIFLSEPAGGDASSVLGLAGELHKLRAELPIFLRRRHSGALDEHRPRAEEVFAGCYELSQLEKLKELVESYLFSAYYPNELVRGIGELTVDTLRSAFRGVEIMHPVPYIVRDKLIYGELFSLMPIESDWCRGYMMFQGEEKNMLDMIRARKTQLAPKEPHFRDVNNLLSEIANMAWGGFKARFVSQSDQSGAAYRTHVPIIINHAQRFISFGAEYPQLCFQYQLTDTDGLVAPVTLYQKFVFSLHWSPEKFEASRIAVDDLLKGGELQLF